MYKYIIDMGLMNSNWMGNTFISWEYFIHPCFLKILLNFSVRVVHIRTVKEFKILSVWCSEKIYFLLTRRKYINGGFAQRPVCYSPMVVITVHAKNSDCPKLQLGSPETFLAADTPLLLAAKTSFMKFSIESSEKRKKKVWFDKAIETGCVDRMWFF